MSLRQRVGRRGAALLFFALVYLVYGYGLLNPPRPLTATYLWPQELAPLWVWAIGWASIGVLCLAFAFTIQDTVGFTAAIAPAATWGLLFLIGQLSGTVDRAYVSVVLWLGFAAFVYLIAGGIPPPVPGRKGRAWIRSSLR